MQRRQLPGDRQIGKETMKVSNQQQTAAALPEIVKLLLAEPDAQRLVRAFVEAAAWIAGPGADAMPQQRAQVAAELIRLAALEREIREMRVATETRWDGRSSAFLQADAVARNDHLASFESLNRLAEVMTEVRARS
jgi:hypothetical protein